MTRPKKTRKSYDMDGEAAGLRWIAYPENTKRKGTAECVTCGHRWSVTGGNVQQGYGCPECDALRRRGTTVYGGVSPFSIIDMLA